MGFFHKGGGGGIGATVGQLRGCCQHNFSEIHHQCINPKININTTTTNSCTTIITTELTTMTIIAHGEFFFYILCLLLEDLES